MKMPPRAVFEIYLDDDRYSVPTLHLLVAATDEAAAWRVAEEMMRENAHHRGAELWRDDQRVAVLGSCAADGEVVEADFEAR
jgi:hypothetical protein